MLVPEAEIEVDQDTGQKIKYIRVILLFLETPTDNSLDWILGRATNSIYLGIRFINFTLYLCSALLLLSSKGLIGTTYKVIN